MKKFIITLLCLTMILCVFGCAKKTDNTKEPENSVTSDADTTVAEVSVDIPDDFSFSLAWDCFGNTTYDSTTGKLVKQKIATDVNKYTTTFFMTPEQKEEVYRLVSEMDPMTYPDEYNPIIGYSIPSRTIILTVTLNGETKTITCQRISQMDYPDGEMGEKFMNVHDKIVEIVTGSAEWKALPEYEFFYD